ncbi:MAG: response regulator [Pirellulales bacterium]
MQESQNNELLSKILIVDDEIAVLKAIQRRLEVDYECDIAESGISGLEKIKSNHYPVIITDMTMPEMSGVDFIQQARAITPETVFMILTGNQDETSLTKARQEGQVFRILNKPCSFSELQASIEAARKHYRFVNMKRGLENELIDFDQDISKA